MFNLKQTGIHLFVITATLISLIGCSGSSDGDNAVRTGSDTDSGTTGSETTTESTVDKTLLEDALRGSGLYSYVFNGYDKAISFTQMYTADARLNTTYFDYLFNENSNLLELKSHSEYWSDCYIAVDDNWKKVTEKLDWYAAYSYDSDGALITTNVFGSYKTKVTGSRALEGIALKSVLADEARDVVLKSASFSSDARMLDVQVENVTKRRLYLHTYDGFEADGHYGSFDTMDDLRSYYAKDNSGGDYIKNNIGAAYDAQFDTDGTIYFYDYNHDILPLTGTLTQKSLAGVSFYVVNVPEAYDNYRYLGKVIFAEVDGSVRHGLWNEDFSESWPLQMFNESGMNDIKDAVERGFQQ